MRKDEKAQIRLFWQTDRKTRTSAFARPARRHCASERTWAPLPGNQLRKALPAIATALCVASRGEIAMILRRGGFLRSCFAAMVGVSLLAHFQDCRSASPVTEALNGGRIGSLQMGMAQSEVESLLQHRLPADLDDQSQVAAVTLTEVRDLQLLHIDAIAGYSTDSVRLGFDTPLGGDRKLIAISIGLSCDELFSLADRLGSWGTEDPGPGNVWGIQRRPVCQLMLWRRPG